MIEPKINNFNKIPIDSLNREEFVEELSEIIKKINIKSFSSIYRKIFFNLAFFTEFISEFDIIVDNLVRTGRSDVIITYGNNCDLAKILISHVFTKLKEKDPEIEIKTLNFNAFIHEKEEEVLNEICMKFGLESQRNTFESTCKTIENYFKFIEAEENNEMDLDLVDTFTLKNCHKNKRNAKTIFVIYYDNIEFLFHKQKQVLFYTLLEIVNISKNIIFCGTSRTFNLTDLMEKRIRSRFSQKTFYLDLINIEDIGIYLQLLIQNGKLNDLNLAFFENLTKNENFINYIEKCFQLGVSIRELFFNLKLLFSNITIALKKDEKQTIVSDELKSIIDSNVMKLFSLNFSNLTYLYSKLFFLFKNYQKYIS